MGASRYETEVMDLLRVHAKLIRSNGGHDVYELPDGSSFPIIRHRAASGRIWKNLRSKLRRALRGVESHFARLAEADGSIHGRKDTAMRDDVKPISMRGKGQTIIINNKPIPVPARPASPVLEAVLIDTGDGDAGDGNKRAAVPAPHPQAEDPFERLTALLIDAGIAAEDCKRHGEFLKVTLEADRRRLDADVEPRVVQLVDERVKALGTLTPDPGPSPLLVQARADLQKMQCERDAARVSLDCRTQEFELSQAERDESRAEVTRLRTERAKLVERWIVLAGQVEELSRLVSERLSKR